MYEIITRIERHYFAFYKILQLLLSVFNRGIIVSRAEHESTVKYTIHPVLVHYSS